MNFWQKMALGVLFAPSVVILGGCDSLWDAEMDVSPDYYGVGVSVPTYGYNPGPPPIDPNIWGPVWGNWNGPIGYYPPAPPMGVRPAATAIIPASRPICLPAISVPVTISPHLSLLLHRFPRVVLSETCVPAPARQKPRWLDMKGDGIDTSIGIYNTSGEP